MAKLSDLLAAYEICARAEGKSPKTLRAVAQAVSYFNDFLGDIEAEQVTANHLRQFILALGERKKYSNHRYTPTQDSHLSPDSIASYVRSIRSLFSLLAREGVMESNPLEKVKVPKTPKRIMPSFTEKQVEKLLAQPDKQSEIGLRDYCVMLVLLDTGIRVSELCGLKVDEVDLSNRYLRVLGKGDRERLVPLGVKAIRTLVKYKVKYRSKSNGCDSFFTNKRGEPLQPRRVEAQIARYGERARLEGVRVSPHTFRSTSAVLYLRHGGDTFTLQRKLGHSTLEMTRRYCNLADGDIRSAHLKHSPADRLKV